MLRDHRWTERLGHYGFGIALLTFGILALELALIRWVSGQIRVFAYFNNLVMIGAFLGMGLGVALGKKLSGLTHFTLPALALLSLVLGFAEPLHLTGLSFPDPTVHLWGGEDTASTTLLGFLGHAAIFLGVFAAIVGVFVCAGAGVGTLFSRLSVLRAYTWDLSGSLLGILAFTALTFTGATPPFWFALACAPFAWLSRRPLSWASWIAIVALSAYSVGDAVFSPYNRIDLVTEPDAIQLSVNRDFHQYMHDLRDAKLAVGAASPENLARRRFTRATYDLPFTINETRGRALVVGAGTGNDVQAALRAGFDEVVSVDIDREIIQLGMRMHPERPYDDARVTPVVNDARAFFGQYSGQPFAAVVYGLLDSHAMFGTMSSLRLDNYVYTQEGIRAAYAHVGPRGHLSLSFSVYAGPWLLSRLYWTIEEATGQKPVVLCHGMQFGCAFIVAPDPSVLRLDRVHIPSLLVTTPREQVRTTSDDWPFLYVRPDVIPWGYIVVLFGVLAMAAFATPLAFGRRELWSAFDPVLFFMGAAFLLIETRGVTSMSLLFGSTWLVNASIFSGILVMVLIANIVVERFQPTSVWPFCVCLALSVFMLWLIEPSVLSALPLWQRGVVGGLLNGLPIGAAGVVVSMALRQAANPTAALGSNLLGSVLGGCTEYLSMALGLRSLVLLAAALYLMALLAAFRRSSPAGSTSSIASRA